MAAVLAFLAGVFINWPAFGILVLLGILFEHNEAHGWAIFTGIIVALVSYFLFDVTLASIGIGIVCYVVIGLLWSFWRYKRYADDIVKKHKNSSEQDKRFAMVYLHPTRMIGIITTWILVWPFSVIEDLVGDILTLVQQLVKRVFRSVYFKIYNSVQSKLGITPTSDNEDV